jgi:hypothetical protein
MVALGKDLFRARGSNGDGEAKEPQSYHSIDNFTGLSLLEHARPMFEVRQSILTIACVHVYDFAQWLWLWLWL